MPPPRRRTSRPETRCGKDPEAPDRALPAPKSKGREAEELDRDKAQVKGPEGQDREHLAAGGDPEAIEADPAGRDKQRRLAPAAQNDPREQSRMRRRADERQVSFNG